MCILYKLISFAIRILIVPNSTNVTVTAPSNHTVGHSLILKCSVTTVRGITSRIDIEWSIGNVILQKTKGTGSTLIVNDSVLYETFYNIAQVSTLDDNRAYQCKAVINANPQLTATDNVILDVTGNN